MVIAFYRRRRRRKKNHKKKDTEKMAAYDAGLMDLDIDPRTHATHARRKSLSHVYISSVHALTQGGKKNRKGDVSHGPPEGWGAVLFDGCVGLFCGVLRVS